jgi:hypothetical protein
MSERISTQRSAVRAILEGISGITVRSKTADVL